MNLAKAIWLTSILLILVTGCNQKEEGEISYTADFEGGTGTNVFTMTDHVKGYYQLAFTAYGMDTDDYQIEGKGTEKSRYKLY
ncbi:hypothetical protein [Peribacillus sp. SCS-37]|uniref:hypothetical protein n=1 Tax=Paraperibacillus esterisolvens TaxID=3115296 RepID=UPI003906797B